MESSGKRTKSTAASSAVKGRKKDQGQGSGQSQQPIPPAPAAPRPRNVSRKKLFCERGMDLPKLAETRVPDLIEARGWHQLVSQPPPINEGIVREFYRVAQHATFGRQGVTIRGTLVRFTPSMINAYFGIDNSGARFDPRVSSITKDYLEDLKEFKNEKVKIGGLEYGELSVDMAFMTMWSRCSFIQAVAPNQMGRDEVKMLLCLKNGWQLNVGAVLVDVIGFNLENLDKKKRPANYLFLPALISGLCERAGVPRLPSDRILEPSRLMGSFCLKNVNLSRGGRPSSKRKKEEGQASTAPSSSQQGADPPTAETTAAGQQIPTEQSTTAAPTSTTTGPTSSQQGLPSDQFASILGAIAANKTDLQVLLEERWRREEAANQAWKSSVESQLGQFQLEMNSMRAEFSRFQHQPAPTSPAVTPLASLFQTPPAPHMDQPTSSSQPDTQPTPDDYFRDVYHP